jgi:hypothetical protein
MDAIEASTFPIVLALSLRVRDPLFVAKDAIVTSSVIVFLSTDVTYVLLETEIDRVIRKQQTQAWGFIDWNRYSTLPCQIRARSYKHVGSRPTEKVLSTDREVREALKKISNSRSGDHLVVSVVIYEGDEPPEEESTVMEEDGGRRCC